MLSRIRLTTRGKAAQVVTGVLLLLFALTACQHPKPLPPPAPPPKVSFNETYDKEIKEILDLAGQKRWEEAETKAAALYQQDPKNPIVARVYSWVTQSAQQQRAQALENKIRDVDSQNSAFNPTLKSLLLENKDRGLPPKKDIRDNLDRIENTPYIPDSYGKVIREKGPLFDLESTKGRMAKVLEKEVSIHLDSVPLETVLANLGQTSGVNIIYDKSIPALKQTLSMGLDKVRLDEFLRYIGRNYDLQFQVGNELVWVVDAKDPKKLMEETRFYRLRKGFVLPAGFGAPEVNKVTTTAPGGVVTVQEAQKLSMFVNDQAPTMPSLERAIKDLWSGSSSNKYMIDYERNLVIARGTEEQLHEMERLIEEFDRPIQQVLIEARFVTLSKPAFLQLGVLWETDRQTQRSTPQDFTGIINSQNFPTAVIPGSASAAPPIGVGIQQTFTRVFGAQGLSATISALEQSGESQTLSAPRLTVLNNRPATISDGKVQYYYEEYAVKQTVQQYYTASSFVPSGKPTKITAGAELNVMASISGDGKSIVLALNPRVNTDVQLVKYATVSDFDQNGKLQDSFDINLPQYRTQEISTRVAVKSGDTVAMGGVLERERSTFVESVPVLGSLPIVGTLFRRRTEVDTPRYLLIFVTATIVKDTGEFLVYEDDHAASPISTVSTNTPALGK